MKNYTDFLEIGIFKLYLYEDKFGVNAMSCENIDTDLFKSERVDEKVKWCILYFKGEYCNALFELEMYKIDSDLINLLKKHYNKCLNQTVSVFGDDILKVVNYE